ncbi:MAG: FKBP-type peptidyl-prolyl cis-trans isomerase [Lachnobacterium sp.]|nr:FKBP-type peptidyl-prolyl cis-trans isomerase [Lachnobacterium sp.]MCI7533313.1 FKBP-type peptidyl-prolyl cis-trans isomerase [Lachnobacterium sp.]
MKKRMIALLLCMTTVFAMTGCGNGSQKGTEAATESSVQETYNGPSSAQMDIDLSKQVTKLADYKGIDVTITGDYDVTDEQVNERTLALLNYRGVKGAEVTDRDTVQDGDLVLVDYTGYHNNEAFDGGSATDVMIDVSNNCEATQQTGYIDGFSDGLIGAKVGEETSSDVKFPDEYSNNPDLAGEMTTFKFKVKGIYKALTLDDLTDAKVKENFSDAQIETKEDLIKNVRAMMESQASSSKSQDTVNKVQTYMLDNSEVTIPDEYLEARLAEYQAQYTRDNVGDTQTLEEYLQANNTTLADMQKTWKTSLEKQIKLEFIFDRIAELEGLEIDQDKYEQFIDYIISSGNSELSTEASIYDYYGNGNKEDGKKNLKRLYLTNDALSFVVENANVTVQKADSTEN